MKKKLVRKEMKIVKNELLVHLDSYDGAAMFEVILNSSNKEATIVKNELLDLLGTYDDDAMFDVKVNYAHRGNDSSVKIREYFRDPNDFLEDIGREVYESQPPEPISTDQTMYINGELVCKSPQSLISKAFAKNEIV